MTLANSVRSAKQSISSLIVVSIGQIEQLSFINDRFFQAHRVLIAETDLTINHV
jgi:hypothetical protein